MVPGKIRSGWKPKYINNSGWSESLKLKERCEMMSRRGEKAGVGVRKPSLGGLKA
jgi:hypothetical protein